ncbi:MAG: peroxidase [Gaiellaceae bacterium]
MDRCAHDYRTADLPAPVLALCDYAVKLTHTPTAVGGADVEELRRHGWDDQAIHDAIQVIAYFNYINRVAEGVGVGPEPEWGREEE